MFYFISVILVSEDITLGINDNKLMVSLSDTMT